MEEARKATEAEDEYLREFAAMPPRERFGAWREAHARPKWGFSAARIRSATSMLFVIRGIDVVPYLAEAVRDSSKAVRFEAITVLTDMDRFVPQEEFIVPFQPSIRPLDHGGSLNPYMTVDGRRIGTVGVQAVQWAINEASDKDLRLYAALLSGEFLDDLRHQSLDELIEGWRDHTIRAKGRYGLSGNTNGALAVRAYNAALLERGVEALPRIAAMLEDRDAWVRGEAWDLLVRMDQDVIRLRMFPEGRAALDKLHAALLKGNMKPLPRDREQGESIWKTYAPMLMQDEWPMDAGCWLGSLAFAFQIVYGDKTTKPSRFAAAYEPIAEMRGFLKFLTETDPRFPSWAFINSNGGFQDAIFHPKYRKKLDHYHEAWKMFLASRAMEASKPE